LGDGRDRPERMLDVIAEWTALKCDCGSNLFLPVVQLKYKGDNGGTTTSPAGHKCAACGAIVDNAYMVKLIDIQKKRAEGQRLLAEARDAEATMAPPKAVVTPAGRS
jgi:hypothetical protein